MKAPFDKHGTATLVRAANCGVCRRPIALFGPVAFGGKTGRALAHIDCAVPRFRAEYAS